MGKAAHLNADIRLAVAPRKYGAHELTGLADAQDQPRKIASNA